MPESSPDPPDPPERARRWAEATVQDRVVEVVALGGGMTRTKWVLGMASSDPLVLRWADPLRWGTVGREHVRREASACRLLAGSALPLPRLIGTDPDGCLAGGPANLMTWRPGRVRLDPLAPTAITSLAQLAVDVHRQCVPAEQRPPTFTFRGADRPEVPRWARWPDLWRRAIRLRAGDAPATPHGLLHRDFHLGNVVWGHDTVTGLVDWAETSWGPPNLDVAHVCADFAMLHTLEDADAFRSAYLRQGGRLDPDPDAANFWVVSDILGFLPDPAHILASVSVARPDLTSDRVRHGLEDLLAATLS